MDAELLLHPNVWLRAGALALILLPPLFILFSRRAALLAKLAWALCSQLPWLFALVYTWVWQQRYEGGDTPDLLTGWALPGAIGWWTYAFPWAVYLLYRATRRRFAGEPRRDAAH